MTFSDEIVKKCAYDSELKKIVSYIASLDRKHRDKFKKKLNLYFMDKNTDDDIEAYKFYKLLVESDNAIKLKESVEKLLSGK